MGISLPHIYFFNRQCLPTTRWLVTQHFFCIPLSLLISGPRHLPAGCLQWPLCQSPVHLPRSFPGLVISPETSFSITDLTMPTSRLTSYLWLLVVQEKHVNSLAWFVRPVLSCIQLRKPRPSLFPTPGTQVLTQTHTFFPFQAFLMADSSPFHERPPLHCQFLHSRARALPSWETSLDSSLNTPGSGTFSAPQTTASIPQADLA